jgi:hypothetical protein
MLSAGVYALDKKGLPLLFSFNYHAIMTKKEVEILLCRRSLQYALAW